MILAIDIGNTNIVLGCMDGTRILVEARMATDLLKTSDQYCVELKNLLNLYEVELPAIEGVIISSVVPPVLNSCPAAVRKLTGKTPIVVGPGIKTGLNIQMENPAQIGSDLIVAAVAALSRFTPPLIIVDMGTATTMTAIDKTGTYVGGCISPGPKLSAESLRRARRSCPPSASKRRSRPSQEHRRRHAQRRHARLGLHGRRHDRPHRRGAGRPRDRRRHGRHCAVRPADVPPRDRI